METLTCRSIRVRPGYGVVPAATVGGLVGGYGLLGVAIRVSAGVATPWQFTTVVCACAALALYAWASSTLRTGGTVQLMDGAVRVGWRSVEASRVEDGYVITPAELVLRLKGGAAIFVELEDERAADVLAHLGVSVEEHALSMPTSDAGLLTALGIALFTLTALAAVGLGFWLSLGIAVAGAAILARRANTRIVVGIDGVQILGGSRSRFIPYSSIEGVGRKGDTLFIETASDTLKESCGDAGSAEALDALVARIEERRAAATDSSALPLEQLDRKGREVAEWHAALRELARAESGFRDPALADDELETIVADTTSPLDRRVGAALALRSRDENARTRIRVAADTAAERRTRIALTAAAAANVDEKLLTRALAPRRDGQLD